MYIIYLSSNPFRYQTIECVNTGRDFTIEIIEKSDYQKETPKTQETN
jgi:hypothetical protein